MYEVGFVKDAGVRQSDVGGHHGGEVAPQATHATEAKVARPW